MKTLINIATVSTLLTSCSSYDMMLRPLKPAIVDAASDSKAAGVPKFEMEFTVVYANTAELSAPPTPFVQLKANGSRSETTRVKVSIDELGKWNPPLSDSAVPDGLYRLDTLTGIARPVKSGPSLR